MGAAALRVGLRVDLHHRAGDGQDPGERVEVLAAQLGELPPAQSAVDGGLDQQRGVQVGQGRDSPLELVRVKAFTGTVGVLTPRQGCSSVTWSSSAVVKIALSTILLERAGMPGLSDQKGELGLVVRGPCHRSPVMYRCGSRS